MLSPDKTGLLKAFLGGLPGSVAARLAMAVEIDRLMDGHALPHDDILESLRPTLRRDTPDRTLTPLRLFCRPFQDLLTSSPRTAKQKGSIARAGVAPVWDWVSQSLIPDAACAFVAEAKALILQHRTSDAIACAARFWPVAAQAMTEALDSSDTRDALAVLLGEEATVEDAREMALLLGGGADVEKLAALLPRPVPAFNEDLVWKTREIYEQMIAALPDAAPYVAVIAMNRLAKPWEALRLPMLVTRKHDETLIAQTDMGLVGDILFGRMEAIKTAIHLTRHPLFDAEVLMENVRAFCDLSSQLSKEIELKRDGEWGKRLLAERAMIGKVMEGFMDRAPRAFAEALPVQKGTGADFGKAISAEKQEMALRYARLVTGSRNFAAAASFAAKQKEISEELGTALQRYNDDAVKALKADPAHAVINAQFELCVALTGVMFSAEEAELLKRRKVAAQAAA